MWTLWLLFTQVLAAVVAQLLCRVSLRPPDHPRAWFACDSNLPVGFRWRREKSLGMPFAQQPVEKCPSL
ncbi:MAG: hypothetical protein RMI89_01195 [Gloeomargarita sp. SKYBB_i_bin120]|nr:hypothetical protein [Gloeomargarita sp. SKYG98]MCS7291577.1 hypothetical protein [Gloeomargarita sp. SKYB120]MDW8177137.1 hypothetical protein [Gloeomargarita sp. SKYBB_i_bin120]